MKRFGLNVALLLHIACACPAITAGTEPFTLADADLASRSALGVLSRGFDSPRQRHMAWIEDGNLVLAREPDFIPKVLVSREQKGRISRLAFSSDGSLIYVRAGTGPAAVPEMLKLDPEGSSAPELVASGTALPAGRLWFAPGGEAFAFVDGKLVLEFRRVATGQWERRSLLEANDPRHNAAMRVSNLVYSPDGTKIAFVSWRKARQKYVAIHDIASHETRYIDPGIFRDDAPVWSPDGTELAFVREPGNWTMNYRFTPQRAGATWSIAAANVNTGAVRTLWKADPGPGSVRTTFDPLPIWTPGGQILFTWEKTGWNLLYSVSASGGTAKLLTPGEGEVESVTVSADGRRLAYSANIGDLSRGHIWSIALPDDRPVQLTSGKGVENRPQYSASGLLSYASRSGENVVPQLLVRSPGGEVRRTALLPSEATKRNEAVWRQFLPADTVAVKAADGVTSYHVIIKPRIPPPTRGYPVIVYVHGGPAIQTRPGGGQGYTFGEYAANHGYLFVDINYRGSTGFGLDYRLPEGGGAMGGSEVKDLEALVGYFKSRGDVDPKRVGIMGHSYGGHIVGLAMSRMPDDFAAAVSLNGVADWNVEMKKDEEDGSEMSEPPEYIRLSERARIEDLAYASSPSANIANWRGPTLLTFGDLDVLGHAESVIDLGYRLLERGVPVEFCADPAGGHNVFPQQRVFDFFERKLQRTGD